MLLHYLHYDYIDVTGVIAIVMDIWGDRHASACNPSFVSIVLVRLGTSIFVHWRLPPIRCVFL